MGPNSLVNKKLQITGEYPDICNLYVLKKSVKTSVNVDNSGPWCTHPFAKM
jgi:hypothetical protein